MSKNMTRKGLAFGATFALGAGLISGVPAVAAGTADGSVTLLPNVGAEYVVRSGDYFDLKANYDASLTASSRFLKFLVEDAGSKTKFDIDVNGSTADAATALTITDGDFETTGDTITLTFDRPHGLLANDKITLDSSVNGLDVVFNVTTITSSTVVVATAAAANGTADSANTTGTVTEITLANGTTKTYDGLQSVANIAGRTFGGAAITGARTHVDDRSLFGSYVVKGLDNTVANDQVLRLISTDATITVSVDVTAWIDNNGNDEIDPTEKVSTTRTVSFLKAADISATTTIRPATVGDSTVTVDVVTSPVLNGLMVIANEGLTTTTVTAAALGLVKFTRQGDATVVSSTADGSYSNTTKKWTFTSPNFNNAAWAEIEASKPANLAATADDIVKHRIVSNVARITTSTAHGLRVGDTITVNATAARYDATSVKVTSVPTTTTFTYAVATANEGADLAEADVTDANAITVVTLLRNTVEAGTITARFFFDNTNGATVANTGVGATASYAVGAKVVGSSGLSIVGVPSATVNAAGKVFKGTTTAGFEVVVKDADGVAVGAGVDVVITAQRTAGTSTITANGTAVGATAVTLYGKTDANGKVAIALTNSAGAVGDTVALTANSQGATQATLNAVWEDKVYTIHDLADLTYANSVRSRLVASGASYTMNFLVQDQWKALAGADVRLKATVTGRTVVTQVVALTNGTGSIVIPDGGLTTGDTTVQVEGELKSATTGLWALADASFADWDAAAGIDLATVAIKYAAASSINFNADAANFPSSTAADYTASVTSLTPVALDGRVSNAVAPAFTAASKAVVSGNVVNASGVATAGASVTVAGTGLAFKAGDVWALDTITFVTDGTFAVEVYSRSSGAKTVKVTSGAATKDATVTFTSLGTTTGYTVTLDAPASVVPGSTFKISGSLKDVNGNAITVTTAGTGANPTLTVGYQGRGLVSGTLPTTTDASGNFFFYVLVGSTDIGEGVVTASYDADGTGTARAAVTVSKTVTIAAVEPVAKIGSFNGRVAVRVENAKGSTISVKIGRSWYKYSALNNNYLQSWKSTKGASVAVSVYVDGELQNVQTITVK